MEGLNFGGFAVGAGAIAAVTIIAAFWNKIQPWLLRMVSPVIAQVDITDPKTCSAFLSFLKNECKRVDFGLRTYGCSYLFIRPKGRHGFIPMEKFSEVGGAFRFGWFPLWVEVENEEGADRGDESGKQSLKTIRWQLLGIRRISIRYIRFSFKKEWFVRRAADILNAGKAGDDGFRVETIHAYGKSMLVDDNDMRRLDDFKRMNRPIDYTWNQIGNYTIEDPLGHLALNTAAEKVVKELKHFQHSRDWYVSRSIPYKRGILVYGVPGTGKTSFVRAVAQELDIPIYVFDLVKMSNGEFSVQWRAACSGSQLRIMLIEDIDNIFDKRINLTRTEDEPGVTFDCLLNTIDGVDLMEGSILFLTTNDITKLDEALGGGSETASQRPGRVDHIVHMGAIDEAGRRKIARRILIGFGDAAIDQLVSTGSEDTPAQFQERCFQAALHAHYKEGV